MLDDDILLQYIHNFYGYGNLNSNYWFISLEEGGGHSEIEIQNRINSWKKRGSKEIEDCKDYHIEIGIRNFFTNSPILQSTWKTYIRIFFISEKNISFINGDNDTQKRMLRNYQSNDFGRTHGQMCMMELRPLPSKNLKTWIYPNISNFSFLKTKQEYQNYVDTFRSKEIQNKIDKYNPKFVIFLSRSKETVPIWSKIANTNFEDIKEFGFLYSKKNQTNFIISEHAVAKYYLKYDKKFGLGNAYFNNLGNFLSKLI